LKRLAHREGKLIKDVNEKFKSGQYVQIIMEEHDKYVVRKCYASPLEKIDKNSITTI